MRAALLCSILLCGHVIAVPIAAQQCPAGRPPAGDLGIAGLLCRGPAASCAINVRSDGDDRVRHVFAVEPVITRVDGNTDVRAGDTLVAIDSVLITTAAGGERLARAEPGASVRLLVRRAGVLRELRLEVGRGCGIRSLTVSR